MLEPAPLIETADAKAPPGGEASWFTGAGGAKLRAALFTPSPKAGPVRGSIVLSGGRTEPIEKYYEFIGELLDRGFVVLAHDWRGQGLSQRDLPDPLKGYVRGYKTYLDDFRALLGAYSDRLPKPWTAVAHSMGGCLTLLAMAHGETRFAGAVLSAPMLGLRTPFPLLFSNGRGFSTRAFPRTERLSAAFRGRQSLARHTTESRPYRVARSASPAHHRPGRDLFANVPAGRGIRHPGLARLGDFATGDPSLTITWLENIGGKIHQAIPELLACDPALSGFSEAQKLRLFELWSQHDPLDDLVQAVAAHPEWTEFAWPGLARWRADHHEWQAAWELVRQNAPRPILPAGVALAPLPQLEQQLANNPLDPAVGFALYRAQIAAGRIDDALGTLRHFTARSGAPGLFLLPPGAGLGGEG